MSVDRQSTHLRRRKFPGWREKIEKKIQNCDKTANNISSRVIGTLLGSIDGGVVTLSNCYKERFDLN